MENYSTNGTVRYLAVALLAVAGAAAGFGQTAEELRMTVGKSIVIDYPADIRQISTSNPDVIDASPVTTREILMHGKGLGNATLVVWAKTGERMFYNVTVDLNLDPLRKILKESFPDENIVPDSSRDAITLNGKVSNKEIGDRAVALSTSFGKTIVNNLQVADPGIEKQILLRVRFAELDRSYEEQYGVSFIAVPGQTAIGASTGQFGSPAISAPGAGTPAVYTIPQALTAFAFDPKLNLGEFIRALQSENILQILAEPNLLATNGKEAYFLVGGQVPVPVLQGGSNSGAVTVQFKEFGIRLRFTPFVTAHGTIKMHLFQEVSALDKADSVTISGFSVPAFTNRTAETDIELAEGQSFVVAGLLENNEADTFQKMPIIGSIPILGAFFKSKDETKSRTDLILIVTPELTRPLGPNDPKPEIAFPRKFLVKLSDIEPNSKTPAKKN